MDRDLNRVLNDIKKRKERIIRGKKGKKESEGSTYLKHVNRILLLIVLFLGVAVYMRTSEDARTNVFNRMFNENFSFHRYSQVVRTVFGELNPLRTSPSSNAVAVFGEQFVYESKTAHEDGVKLTVSDNFTVPALQSGIVVFIGERDGIENLVIVQGVDGIDTWYSGIDNLDVRIYEYIERGSSLGRMSGNELFLMFKRDGEALEYEQHLP